MNVDRCHRGSLICRLIRLHGCRQCALIRSVDALFIEACHKIKVFVKMQSVLQHKPRIKINISSARRNLNLQNVLLVHQHFILDLQCGI